MRQFKNLIKNQTMNKNLIKKLNTKKNKLKI